MKVKIKNILNEVDYLDIELPQYYKYVHSFTDAITYTKVDKDMRTLLYHEKESDEERYEIIKENHTIDNGIPSSYFQPNREISENEFKEVLTRCINFISE